MFGGDVHVVWEKFCRYFDVEPRIVPLQEDKYTIGPEDVEPHIDENTIGVAAVLGTTFTGHADDITGHQRPAGRAQERQGPRRPAARGRRQRRRSYGRSSTRTPSGTSASSRYARSTSPVTSSGSSIPASAGWCSGRSSDLPEDLVFYENYLGKTDATFTLNFSTGSAMVLAQYYNFVRFGHDGYRYIMEMMQRNAASWPSGSPRSGEFEMVGADEEQLPLVAFKLAGGAELRRVRRSRAAGRRARLDGPRLHAAAGRREREDHARAGQGDAQPRAGDGTLADDIAEACETLEQRAACTRPSASASRPVPATK